MKRLVFFGGGLLILTTLVGCGNKQTVLVSPDDSGKKKEITKKVEEIVAPNYEYRGERYRDPFFTPSSGKIEIGTSENLLPFDPSFLSLKGIIHDKEQVLAILSSGGESYYLRNGQLYNRNNQLIKGIRGEVRKNQIILITSEGKHFQLGLQSQEY